MRGRFFRCEESPVWSPQATKHVWSPRPSRFGPLNTACLANVLKHAACRAALCVRLGSEPLQPPKAALCATLPSRSSLPASFRISAEPRSSCCHPAYHTSWRCPAAFACAAPFTTCPPHWAWFFSALLARAPLPASSARRSRRARIHPAPSLPPGFTASALIVSLTLHSSNGRRRGALAHLAAAPPASAGR